MMQELLTIDDLPAADVELEPEKIDDGKNGGPSFHCDLYDTELVHKIAQGFVPGLATACVDNTSGDIFRTPASVAAKVRKEMVEYITQRSENFVAESVILEGGRDGQVSDHPYDIISEFVDDFASSKRNLFSRVSGWLLSEKREDNIDDFVQEMEINGFWLVDKRETIAQSLLQNVDLKNEHHCSMKFHTQEELEVHVAKCSYRSTSCINEGCNAIFCARQVDKHDAVCPLKIIPCEQNCNEMIMRRDMDRHCITVCPMKLVSCPFYAVGCQSPVPHCKLEQHRSDDLHSHMLFVLQSIHKETSGEDLKRRLEKLKDASSSNNLAQARDVRSLSSAVKDLEAKLGPMEISRKQQENLDVEHGPEEIGSKAPEVVEPEPKEVNNKPEEDLVVKPASKEVSQQSEYLEARSEPKEVGTKSVDDLEAKPAQEELSTKPVKDLEAKPAVNEVSSSKPPEDVEARSVIVSEKALTEQEAKQAAQELSTKPAEDLEAKQAPQDISSSKPHEDVEAKSVGVIGDAPTGNEDKPAAKELSTKPAEDLEAKSAPKEVSKSNPPEDVEARSVGLTGQAPTGQEDKSAREELSTKPVNNLEAKPASKEVSSSKIPKDVETRSVGESCLAPTGHEAKPAPKEISSSKPPEDVEEKPVRVSGEGQKGHEATQAPKELSSEPAEDLEAKPAPKEVSSSKPLEDVDTRLVEVSGKAPIGHEEKLRTTEVRSKSPAELETKLGTKEVSSKPPEELETQLGTKEVSNEPPQKHETNLERKETDNICSCHLDYQSITRIQASHLINNEEAKREEASVMEEFEKKLSIRDGEEEEAAAKKKVSTVELLREFLGIQQRRAEAYAKLRMGFARYMESSSSSRSSSAESAYQKLCGDVTQEFSDCSRQVLHLESLFLGPHYDRLDLAHLLRAVQTHEKQKLNLTATLQVLKKAGRPSERLVSHENHCVHLHEITEAAGTEEAEANAQYDIDLKEAIRGLTDSRRRHY
ncbi:hypothetical protein ACLB2K_072924 [Fragaria x ananassa]